MNNDFQFLRNILETQIKEPKFIFYPLNYEEYVSGILTYNGKSSYNGKLVHYTLPALKKFLKKEGMNKYFPLYVKIPITRFSILSNINSDGKTLVVSTPFNIDISDLKLNFLFTNKKFKKRVIASQLNQMRKNKITKINNNYENIYSYMKTVTRKKLPAIFAGVGWHGLLYEFSNNPKYIIDPLLTETVWNIYVPYKERDPRILSKWPRLTKPYFIISTFPGIRVSWNDDSWLKDLERVPAGSYFAYVGVFGADEKLLNNIGWYLYHDVFYPIYTVFGTITDVLHIYKKQN